MERISRRQVVRGAAAGLARSTRDLLNTLAAITAKQAGFKSLGDTWADTTTSHGRLMLTVLGGLAEFERDLIRARTGESRARAVARGQRMGRPPKLTPAPEARGDQAPRQRRGIPCRDRAHLQHQCGDDFTAHGLTYRHPYVGRSVISYCLDRVK
jgi:DNA invertase Pin-like site-specific DNA recombinase